MLQQYNTGSRGGKGLFGLHFHMAVHHQKKSTQGWNLETAADTEVIEGAAYWLAPVACLACFLSLPVQGQHYPQWAGPSLINHSLRKCPAAGSVSQLRFLFQMTPACVADMRLSQHRCFCCLFLFVFNGCLSQFSNSALTQTSDSSLHACALRLLFHFHPMV